MGVVLFELLTLERPFHSAHLVGLVAQISLVNYDVELLDTCGHPPALVRLGSKEGLLHADPSRRATLASVMEMYPVSRYVSE